MLSSEILSVPEFKQILARYQKALQALKDWNIDIPDGSRLYCYEETIKYLASGGTGNSPKHFCDLMFQLIEIDEINDIALSELGVYQNSETVKKLTDIVHGLKIRSTNEVAQPRSSQFELYIKALLNYSGLDCNFKPTEIGAKTPDLTVKLKNKKFDIEVKRPLSSKNILKNIVKKATSQLDITNPGMLILALDHILLGNHNVIELESGDSEKDCLNLLEKETTKWLSNNQIKLMKIFNSKKSVCAILLIVKSPVYLGCLNKMLFVNHLRLVELKGYSIDNSKSVNFISKSLNSVWGKSSYLNFQSKS